LNDIVVDASVALAWCFPDESSAYAEAVLLAVKGRRILVPSVWPLEITNAIVAAERRGRILPKDVAYFVELLEVLEIRQDSLSVGRAFVGILPLARAYGLSAYDAAYLELAIRIGAGLATLDAQLEKAARDADVEIFAGHRLPKSKR
jgi:predicted nucleic acid-binding protein